MSSTRRNRKNKKTALWNKAENIIRIASFIIFVIFSIICFVISLIPNAQDWLTESDVFNKAIWVILPLAYTLIFFTAKDSSKASDGIEELEMKLNNKCDSRRFYSIDSVISYFDNKDGRNNIYIYENNKDIAIALVKLLKKSSYRDKNLYLDYRMADSDDFIENDFFKDCNVFLAKGLVPGIIVETLDNSGKVCETAFIRYVNGIFESIYISDDNIISQLIESYIEQSKKISIKLKTKFSYETLSYFIEFNDIENSELSSNKIGFKISTRSNFFTNMSEVIKKSEQSVRCIDFIPIGTWFEDTQTNEYGKAHLQIKHDNVERIHIFDTDEYDSLDRTAKANTICLLKRYCDFMADNRINLYFVSQKEFLNRNYEMRGSAIVDDQCVFMAINPEKGTTYGEISFKEDVVKDYIERHSVIRSIAIESSIYIKNLEDKINNEN